MMELCTGDQSVEHGLNEAETNGKLLILTPVLWRNKEDLFVRITPSKLKMFVLTLNKMFEIDPD